MFRKKKLLFLIESFIVGGAEKVLIDIVNHLDKNKFDITVCCIFKKSVYKGYDSQFKVSFFPHVHYKYLINNEIGWLYKGFNFLLARMPNLLYKILIGDKYDYSIAFYEGLPTSWIAKAKLKRGKKIAWLHTSTSLSQKGKNKQQLDTELINYKQYNQIIAVSEGVAQSFKHLFFAYNKSIKVVYNPIDKEVLEKKSQEHVLLTKAISPLFVSVGRIAPVKGYNRWIKVLGEIKRKGYHFQAWIIGGGESASLRQLIEKYQLTDNVLLLGHQSNPYPYMRMADWVVCPSFIEGLSTVVLEGIMLGKAIVATECFGMKELLGNSEYGMLCSNTEQDLRKAIERILQVPSLKYNYEEAVNLRRQAFCLNKSISSIERIILSYSIGSVR